MPIQCQRCHKVNRDSAQYCDSCGASLTEPPITSKPFDQKQQSTRPDSLPETDSTPPPQFTRTPTKIPNIKRGPSFGHWLLFILAVLVFHVGIYAILVEQLNGSYEQFEVFLLQGIIIFIIGLFFFLKIAKSKVYIGLVTHMEPWTPLSAKSNKLKTAPKLVFNLQQTHKDWTPIKDNQGFLKPVLEVAFRTSKVHGEPLEEGTRVILKGKKMGEQIRAKEIWNLSSQNASAVISQHSKFWGRVIHKASPRGMPDLRYPGQGNSIEVWEFRLQPATPSFDQLSRDHKGDLLMPIPVEIRARSISGPLQEGDKVEIVGQIVNGTLYVRQLINHSAGGAGLVIKENAGTP